MKEIIIATKNPGKAIEFVEMFKPLGYEIKTLLDYPELPDIPETGTTFQENALLKAEGIAKILNRTVIADDSGLEIDCLNGRPGVYSARYAGEPKSDERNIQKVLEEMKDVPDEKRTAHFTCVLAVVRPDQEPVLFEGRCDGVILREKRGEHGFGYDPIFYVPEKQKTMAEMTPAEKQSISHRGNALKKLQDWLFNDLKGEL